MSTTFNITTDGSNLQGIGGWIIFANLLLFGIGTIIIVIQHFSNRYFISESTKRFAGFAITAHVCSLLLVFVGFSTAEPLSRILLHGAFMLSMLVLAVILWLFIYLKAKSHIESAVP